jgi:O-antigen/teichoic acid export membrane protein
MKINLKEYFKLTVIYTLLAAFPPIIQVFIRPIIEGADRLTADEFSRLSITELIITLSFTLVMFSMNNAIARFHYNHLKNESIRRKMISSIFNSILIRGVILIGITLIIAPHIGQFFSQPELKDFQSYGLASVITGINRAIVLTAASLYRNEKKVSLFVITMLAWGIIRTIFQLIFLFEVDMNFVAYVNGNCLGSIIVAIAILFYVYKTSGFSYDRKILKPIIQFASPLFQYSLIYWAITFIDRLFLESSPIELGIYDTAVSFAFGVQMILQGIQGATQPEIYRLMSDGVKKNMEGIKQLSNILLAQSQLIIAILIIPTMLYLSLFFETELAFANQLIGILFIKFILRSQFLAFSYPIFFLKKTKVFLYINIIVLAVSLISNFYLVPIFKAYGAITAGILAFFLQTILTYYYQKRIINIKWNLKKVLYYPLIIVGITIVLEIVKVQFNINPFLIASLVVFTIFISILFLYKNEIKKYLPFKI